MRPGEPYAPAHNMTPLSVAVVLIIGQLMQTPVGVMFFPSDQIGYDTLEECWATAIRITTDAKSPQVGFCAPVPRKSKAAQR